MQALSRSYPEEKYQNFDKKRFQFMSDTKPCLVINATSEDNLKLYRERDNKVAKQLILHACKPRYHAYMPLECAWMQPFFMKVS